MLTVIVKGTNGCNLSCTYCSLGEKKNFKFIDLQTLKKLFDFSCRQAAVRGENSVNFILHGGEPTLIHPKIYSDAIDYIKEKYSNLNITFSLQTNGVDISDDYLNFLGKYNVHVGISIDGSKEIHDSERCTANGLATYDLVWKNIERLVNRGISVSSLMVLTKNALDAGFDYLNLFAKKGIHLKINPLLNYGETEKHPELVLSKGDYAKYLIEMYQYIIKNDIEITTAPVDNFLRAVLYKQDLRECSFSKECSRNFLCIDYKGDIYPCGKFSDMDTFKIGSIYEVETLDFSCDAVRKLLARRNEKLPDKCMKCKYLHICNAGCSAEAVIDGDINKEPFLCDDYYELFEYFHNGGLRLLKNELQKQIEDLEEQKKWSTNCC